MINGRSDVLKVWELWGEREPREFKKLLKAARYLAGSRRVRDEKFVKADERKSGIYELRAHTGHARILFFYDPLSPSETVIFVHTYWKGSGDQSKAFEFASKLRQAWISA